MVTKLVDGVAKSFPTSVKNSLTTIHKRSFEKSAVTIHGVDGKDIAIDKAAPALREPTTVLVACYCFARQASFLKIVGLAGVSSV